MTTRRLPTVTLRNRFFRVPLDHARPDGPQIDVFAREAVAPEREHDELPWLVFLQGGPGGASPRPPLEGAWVPRALRAYRVLLLDQRGTGLSTPLDTEAVVAVGDAREQARFLEHFRADSIVADCEWIRRELGVERWTLLGQSYGGFCALTYMSFAPEAVEAVMFTGGLAPLETHVDDVYRAKYRRMREWNAWYYERYPDDVDLVRDVARRLPAELPNGDRLTQRGLQQLGIQFGTKNALEKVHYLFERALNGDRLAYRFLRVVMTTFEWDVGLIYSILHEPIYAEGFATRWSAERVRAEFPEVDAEYGPLYFTGETIYPWQFENVVRLRPLREAAELLAQKEDWPPLYDAEVLRASTAPAAAAIYFNDPYVTREESEATAATIGARTWVTDEHEHDALRLEGEAVVDRLLGLLSESGRS